MQVLVVDDDAGVRQAVRRALLLEGYEVALAEDGVEALRAVTTAPPDAIVLDVMMPRLDGLEVCRRIRARTTVPIIMLTAKAEEADRVIGLEIGADDYITKPFSLREFRSRVRAALRRAAMPPPTADGPELETISSHELTIDPRKRAVRIRGKAVTLTFVEFEILRALARTPGIVFSREQLLTGIWGDSAYRDPRTIDVHIRHLREKLERDAKDPEYLFTVRGAGYRFRDEQPASD